MKLRLISTLSFLALGLLAHQAATDGSLVASAAAATGQPGESEPARYPSGGAGAITRGSAQAPIDLVVFVDYECPFCRRVEETVRQLQREHGSDVRVKYAQTPLPFHQEARHAALHVLAADRQGKGLALHDALMATPLPLDRTKILQAAQKVGLNLEQLAKDVNTPQVIALLEAEGQSAKAIGITGTPSSLLNGQAILGAQSGEAFERAIVAELARAQALRKKGVPAGEIAQRLAKPNAKRIKEKVAGEEECECDKPACDQP